MLIDIAAHFAFTPYAPMDCLLQFEAADHDEQRVIDHKVTIGPEVDARQIAAQDGIGQRIWLRAEALVEVS